MTNGEKIKEIFPEAQIEYAESDVYVWLNHDPVNFSRESCESNYSEVASELDKNSKKLENPTAKNDLGVDCISRDEVCRYVAEFVNHEFSTREEEELIDNIITGIERMPSVTPQEPKTGHWNDIPKYKDIAWQCSECNHFTTMKHNYCPNCGAKMVERGTISNDSNL